MRFLFIFLLFTIQFYSSKAQSESFKITLKIEGLNSEYSKIRLTELTSLTADTIHCNDSLSKEKDSIIIIGKLSEERFFYFSIKGIGSFYFGIGPGDTALIKMNKMSFLDNFKIYGSKRVVQSAEYLNKTLISINQRIENEKTRFDSLTIANTSKKKLKKYKEDFDSIFDSIFLFNTNYADTVSSAVASSSALFKYAYEMGEYDISENIKRGVKRFGNLVVFKSLQASYNKRIYHQNDVKKIDTLNLLKIFGKESAIKIIKIGKHNKLVLIDFWASWCKPCIEEFPFLESAYNTYKKKGFEIVSISLDKDLLHWQSAKKRFDMTWSNHFIEQEALNSKPAKALNISSIPRSYLIDKKGRIYGRNLRGTQLQEILSKLL